jgi:alpha(1,3/1,4) fucosyltransferase
LEKVKIKFVDFFKGFDQTYNGIYMLLSKFFNLEISENPDFIFYSVWGNEHLKYSCTKIFITGENVRPNFFLCDYAVGFDFIDRLNYLRMPLYIYWKNLNYQFLIFPAYKSIIENHPKSKFCCFLVSNPKSIKRINFFKKLNQYSLVDSGGKVENNLGYFVSDKLKFMSSYKFMIAYENSSYPGYVTEKIYECFFTNTIPIYWGSPSIVEDFNPNRIINRLDYKSDEELIERVKYLNENKEAYLEFISQPVFNNNVPNSYLREENIQFFFNKIFSGSRQTKSKGAKKQIGIALRIFRNFYSKNFTKSFR